MYDESICIYCGSYWQVGHTDDCPQTTNVYPMSDLDGVDVICAECKGEIHGHYTTVDDVIVCIGCAAILSLL